MKRRKLTRVQKTICNLIIIAAALTILVIGRDESVSLTAGQAVNRELKGLGLSQEDVILTFDWKQDMDRWQEIYLRSNIGSRPVFVCLNVHKTGNLRYKADVRDILYDVPYEQGIRSGRSLTEITGDKPEDRTEYFADIWDFPQLSRENFMRLTDRGDAYQVEVDCLETKRDQILSYTYDELGKIPTLQEWFEPELIFTVDKETEAVTYTKTSEACRRLGMTLSQEEAGELVKRLLIYLDYLGRPM